jgi:hypothetical protein
VTRRKSLCIADAVGMRRSYPLALLALPVSLIWQLTLTSLYVGSSLTFNLCVLFGSTTAARLAVVGTLVPEAPHVGLLLAHSGRGSWMQQRLDWLSSPALPV